MQSLKRNRNSFEILLKNISTLAAYCKHKRKDSKNTYHQIVMRSIETVNIAHMQKSSLLIFLSLMLCL